MAKKKSGGGGKADKALAKAQRVEAKKAKQSQKGAKKDRKALGDEEEDIELILQEFLKKDALKTQVTVEPSSQPSPRANFTLSGLPSGEMLLFGGEYFDGDVNVCFNDVFKWNLDVGPAVEGGEAEAAAPAASDSEALRDAAWKAISSPNSPPPRCSHQSAVFRDHLWFNDLYLFNLAELKWQKVTYPPHKQAPAARSGCQLAVHPSKDLVFVYGGYAKVKNVGEKSEGKVYADLWALNLAPVLKRQAPTWEKLSRKGQAPSPRSGAAVTVHKQRFILFGGVFDEEKRRHTMQSTFFNDLYVYDMDRRRWFEFKLRGKKSTDGKRRRKKKTKTLEDGNGEEDSEEDEEEDQVDDFDAMLDKQFGYVDEDGNIVYIEDLDEEEEAKEGDDGDVAPAPAPEAVVFEEEETKDEERDEDKAVPEEESKEQEQEQEQEEEEEVVLAAPCPRINPSLMIRGSTLYVYGGVVEDGDREITLDDCWSLDLKRLDEWKQLLAGTMDQQEWKGEVSETEESSDGEDDDEDDEEEDEEDEEDEDEGSTRTRAAEAKAAAVERAVEMLAQKAAGGDAEAAAKKEKKKKAKSKKDNHRRTIRAEMEKLQEQLGLDDLVRTPQMGENLRDFFARTDATWASEVMARPSTAERQLSIKEIKREGFALAEARYNELLPGKAPRCGVCL
ncbi:hypothetical protein BBJ28_00016935, partial [Nothophytophthora sp. Chile5]